MSALHRFFVGPATLQGDAARLEGDQARQVAAVLRLGPGDRVILVRDGVEHEAELERVSPGEVTGTVRARRECAAEPRLRLALALPLLRGDRGEEVVEAVTQLGVSSIVPFWSARSVARELSPARRERWQRIARESAETARRGRVPEIADAVGWADLLRALQPPVLVAWEGERATHLADAFDRRAPGASLVIGPEGGLSSDEVALARARGARTVSLGERNLRSETAAVAAVAIVFALARG